MSVNCLAAPACISRVVTVTLLRLASDELTVFQITDIDTLDRPKRPDYLLKPFERERYYGVTSLFDCAMEENF